MEIKTREDEDIYIAVILSAESGTTSDLRSDQFHRNAEWMIIGLQTCRLEARVSINRTPRPP